MKPAGDSNEAAVLWVDTIPAFNYRAIDSLTAYLTDPERLLWRPGMNASKILSSVLVLALPLAATALDRDAQMVNSGNVIYRNYDGMHTLSGVARGEAKIFNTPQWGVVLELGAGKVTSDAPDAPILYRAAGGIKRMFGTRTSLEALLAFDFADSGSSFSDIGFSLLLEQRITGVEATVSPFVKIGASLNAVETGSWATGMTDNFTALGLRFGGGCDFELGEDVILVLEGSYLDSRDLTDSEYGDYADGWSATVAFKYYFR